MADFKYRELKNVGYKNKDMPKVYFCAHPQDHSVYFEEIKSDIISGHTCSVWYDDELSEDINEEMRFSDLAQMNLFVVPVTRKLMVEPNRAMDKEIPFAREHNIPILPLMQEEALDELFSQKFGNLQYLEKTARYANALSFTYKLQKYLSSVLVGDELNKKIKEAFDAYIFLSYRKKDRKYARKLMEIIHENEILRDVAIWYDEFLTPGEDYNVNIASSLKKSNVFALTVTPSLLEKGNYIMTTEFPDAKKEGKPIIPVELVQTDKDELANSYKDIPECINAEEHEKLANEIASMLCGAALKSKDTLPEHRFLIGLAYLGGIDVETNHKRALSLILSSAESGYAPAVEKIAAMYRTGDGVKCDMHEAEKWQSKYTEICEKAYAQEPTEENGIEYAEALETLGDIAENIISNQSRDMATFSGTDLPEASFKALDFARELAQKFSSKATKRRVVSACYNISEKYFLRRNDDPVEKLLLEALEILKGFAWEEKNEETVFDVAECYDRLFCDLWRKGLKNIINFKLAELNVYELAYAHFGTIESARKLAECYDVTAFVYAEMGFKRDGAWDCAEKYLKLMEKISAESDLIEEKRKLAQKYISYSGFLMDNNWDIVDEETRTHNYERAEELLKEVERRTNETKDHCNIADMYISCAGVYESLKNYAKAEGFMLKGIHIYEDLTQRFGAEKYDNKIFMLYGSIANIYAEWGREEDARKYYTLSFDFNGHQKYFYERFISWCLERKDTASLEIFKQKAYSSYLALTENEDGRNKFKSWGSFIENTLRAASICLDAGKNTAAIAFYEGCANICARLESAVAHRSNSLILARVFCHLGELYEGEKRFAEAKNSFCSAAKIMEKLISAEGLSSDMNFASYIYLRYGKILENENKLKCAEAQYMNALELRVKAYSRESTPQAKNAMSECALYLSNIYKKQGGIVFRTKKAVRLYKKISELLETELK